MSTVAVYRCTSYGHPELEKAVKAAVEDVGGISAHVSPGSRVLLKPNMLSAHVPEDCITTHPALVLAVGRMVQEAGGRVMIADSPALDGFKKVAAKSGLAEAAEILGADIFPLTDPVRVTVPGEGAFRSLEISRQALEADVVINLPKLKTHSQMLLTLGVKNLFGVIVAQRKAEWHLAAGLERTDFAALLLDVYRTVAPALTILDGVRGMDGRGPANGRPRLVGLVAASENALALDLTVCRILGVPFKRFPLYRAAAARGFSAEDDDGTNATGDGADLRIDDFELPDLESAPASGRLGRLIRRHLVSRPVQKAGDCIQCGKCVQICPANAMRFHGERLLFDYNGCIRCYCCQEVCPQDAIDFHTGVLARAVALLGR